MALEVNFLCFCSLLLWWESTHRAPWWVNGRTSRNYSCRFLFYCTYPYIFVQNVFV